ncbi:glycoside hydrolase family 88 protein [Lacticaseibacillus parahuelsenbergensis]|uniref:Glycoside hydrolase family 88 protein n=1 Tax=Lacticaseibacillus parahuelsenbergensis TaxID=3068305 RepID=A0ABY9L290_9LACO|nr:MULTISPECIES: glycoside hydrolase family 88 protein [Lacticaseibacillus]MDE3283693.1 glycoside hydrolase family 88 protein [Lacticaseibacillus casei]WLV77804.1 glycoside hydrolase family 88 protein [Lacticaseibacillus sp. NCIMB 15471]
MGAYTKNQLETKIDLLIDNEIHLSDPTGEFFVKVADGSLIDNKSFNFWEWTSGVGLYGMMKYYQLSRKPEVLKVIKDWFDSHFKEAPVEKNINTMVQMLTLAYLYEETGDRAYLPHLEAWGDWLYYRLPRTEKGGFQHVTYGDLNPGEMWADTLMMSVLTLTKLGKVLKKPEYIQEAKKQVLLHIQFLQDKRTGLWYHGWSFKRRDNFSGAFWGRGNSWITIAFPEILELLNLPEGDAFREFVRMNLQYQIDALKKYQDKSGLWHTLIDDPTSYLEGSATAGFTYGILKAVHNHLIDNSYREVALKGIDALFANIDENGALAMTSGGTPMGETKEFYKQVKTSVMPYGQSMAELALTEYLKEFY